MDLLLLIKALLAAQRVASSDSVAGAVARTASHTALQDLNWRKEGRGVVESHFERINVAVQKSIMLFLTAAFGGPRSTDDLFVTPRGEAMERVKRDRIADGTRRISFLIQRPIRSPTGRI